MTSEDKAKAIVDAALNVLHDRKGFDWWWHDCSEEDRSGIKDEMGEAVMEELEKREKRG